MKKQKFMDAPSPKMRRWRVITLMLVMFCYLFYYTGRQTFGFAIPGMERELGLSKVELGWCGTALLWSYALGQGVNGQLADRLGGRNMMALGGILSCALNWVLSFARGLPGIIVPWGLNGLAQSMGWAPGSRILSNWWDKQHRGVVYGWYLFAAGCSSIVAYGLAKWMSGYDWRWIFRFPVLLMLVGSVIFWLFVRDRPSERGLENLPDHDDDSPQEEAEAAEVARNETVRERYMVALGNLPFMLGSFSIGFQSLARYGLLIWVPVHFLGDNWKETGEGSWLSLWLPVGMAVGAISSGWISDKVFGGNRSRVIILFLTLAAVCAWGMHLLPRYSAAVIPMLFMTGFFVYGPQAGYWALCPDLLGRRHTGTGTGVMNFVAYLFAGIGEPTIGHFIEDTGKTSVIFQIVAFACVLGALTMFSIRFLVPRGEPTAD